MKQNELLGHIVIAVCEATKSPTSLIFGTRRNHTAMWSRWLVYLIAHDYCNLSYSAIGRALNRDHTTVMHGVKRATVEYERNAEFREAYIQATMEVRQWMEQQLSRTSTSLSNSLTCQLLRSMDVRTRYPQTSRVPSYGRNNGLSGSLQHHRPRPEPEHLSRAVNPAGQYRNSEGA